MTGNNPRHRYLANTINQDTDRVITANSRKLSFIEKSPFNSPTIYFLVQDMALLAS